MAVYLYTSYDITDKDEYAKYLPNVLPIMDIYGGEIITADEHAIPIDGENKDINVILKFPTAEIAMQMMEDPSYQPWLKLRLKATTNRTSILMDSFNRTI